MSPHLPSGSLPVVDESCPAPLSPPLLWAEPRPLMWRVRVPPLGFMWCEQGRGLWMATLLQWKASKGASVSLAATSHRDSRCTYSWSTHSLHTRPSFPITVFLQQSLKQLHQKHLVCRDFYVDLLLNFILLIWDLDGARDIWISVLSFDIYIYYSLILAHWQLTLTRVQLVTDAGEIQGTPPKGVPQAAHQHAHGSVLSFVDWFYKSTPLCFCLWPLAHCVLSTGLVGDLITKRVYLGIKSHEIKAEGNPLSGELSAGWRWKLRRAGAEPMANIWGKRVNLLLVSTHFVKMRVVSCTCCFDGLLGTGTNTLTEGF